MSFVVLNLVLTILLSIGILVAYRMGKATGQRRLAADPEHARDGLGVFEGVVFALLGLVIAFSFNGAGERFMARRAQVGDEINKIGTAYLRIDVLPDSTQPAMRDAFRRYVTARREAARAIPDETRVRAKLAEARGVQDEIWRLAIAATSGGTASPTSLVFLNPLNEMLDAQTDAEVAMMQHPPFAIEGVLVALMLLAAFFAGEATAHVRRPSRIHVLGLAFLLAAMFFLIRDLERPFAGLIRVDDVRQMTDDLERSMAE